MKWLKKIGWVLLALFVLHNVVAFNHAWKFTHFSEPSKSKTKKPEGLSPIQKAGIILSGIDNPRPVNKVKPEDPYETINIGSANGYELECWYIPVEGSNKTFALFHGYAACKSTLLTEARLLRELGYNTLLVDFFGSGGSSGDFTGIGYNEAEDVQGVFNWINLNRPEETLYLYGVSMGAAAVLRATAELDVVCVGMIIECPFATLREAISARVRVMGLPDFPITGSLLFWGGIQNGFWGGDHNPYEYATKIHTPVLYQYGVQDARVSKRETDLIFEGFKGPIDLVLYEEAGHQSYAKLEPEKWKSSVIGMFPNSDLVPPLQNE